jgi:uncharacterized membrane protein
MDSLSYLTVLRFIHIVTGVFWAGAVFYLAWFIIPAVKASGAEGGKFMQQLAKTNNLPTVMTAVSILTILSGIFLLWKLSAGFQLEWINSRHGWLVSAGSLVAMIAFVEGLLVTRPNAIGMNKLSQEIAAGGQVRTEEQFRRMTIYRNNITKAAKHAAILLALSVMFMSLVHYL